MNTLQRKYSISLAALIIFFAFLIGYHGIYKYNLRQINLIKNQIEEEKRKNGLLEVIGILDKKLALHQQRSFSTAEITPLLNQVSQLARQAGVEIKTFNPQALLYREEFTELPLQIPLSCSYHKLGQFLSLIESNPEFIWVKELRMQKPAIAEAKERQIPTVDLTLSGLYFKK